MDWNKVKLLAIQQPPEGEGKGQSSFDWNKLKELATTLPPETLEEERQPIRVPTQEEVAKRVYEELPWWRKALLQIPEIVGVLGTGAIKGLTGLEPIPPEEIYKSLKSITGASYYPEIGETTKKVAETGGELLGALPIIMGAGRVGEAIVRASPWKAGTGIASKIFPTAMEGLIGGTAYGTYKETIKAIAGEEEPQTISPLLNAMANIAKEGTLWMILGAGAGLIPGLIKIPESRKLAAEAEKVMLKKAGSEITTPARQILRDFVFTHRLPFEEETLGKRMGDIFTDDILKQLPKQIKDKMAKLRTDVRDMTINQFTDFLISKFPDDEIASMTLESKPLTVLQEFIDNKMRQIFPSEFKGELFKNPSLFAKKMLVYLPKKKIQELSWRISKGEVKPAIRDALENVKFSGGALRGFLKGGGLSPIDYEFFRVSQGVTKEAIANRIIQTKLLTGELDPLQAEMGYWFAKFPSLPQLLNVGEMTPELEKLLEQYSPLQPRLKTFVEEFFKNKYKIDPKVIEASKGIRKAHDELWNELLKWDGDLSPQVAYDLAQKYGEYFPIRYKSLLKEGIPKDILSSPNPILRRKAVVDYLKKRKIEDPGLREALGEIREIGFVNAKAMAELEEWIGRLQIENYILAHPDYLWKSENPGDWIRWGVRGSKLYGKYIRPDIAEELIDMRKIANAVNDALEEFFSAMGGKTLKSWKGWKTFWSTATLIRNIITQFTAADIGGLAFYKPSGAKIFAKALKDFAESSRMFKEAKGLGLFMGTFSTEETDFMKNALKKILGELKGNESTVSIMGKIWKMTKKPFKTYGEWMSKIYQWSDEFFRMALYRHFREQGYGVISARNLALKYGIDYSKASKFLTRFLRTKWWGAPFISFSAKAIPLFAEGLIKNPIKTGKWLLFPFVPYFVYEAKNREIKYIRKHEKLPRLRFVPIGEKLFRGSPGTKEYDFVDVGYSTLFGDVGEIFSLWGGGSALLPFSSPTFLIAATIVSSVMQEKSGRIGGYFPMSKIWEAKDPLPVKLKKLAEYLYYFFAPNVLGWHVRTWYQALTGKHPTGRPPSIGEAALRTIYGIKTIGYTPEHARIKQIYSIKDRLNELQRRLNYINLQENYNPNVDYTKEKQEIMDEMGKLRAELRTNIGISEIGGE